MKPLPQNLPRFLPTLTEVIEAHELSPVSVPGVPPAVPVFEEVVRTVMQRLEGVIERRLREELDLAVRQAVTQIMNLPQTDK